MNPPKNRKPELRPRIRILCAGDIALGPGKAELLDHIASTGSLNKAAKLMRISYMKAWLLVQVMNRSFKKPLVRAERGGTAGGGAKLTPTGKTALALYRQMHSACVDATAAPWAEMRGILKK